MNYSIFPMPQQRPDYFPFKIITHRERLKIKVTQQSQSQPATQTQCSPLSALSSLFFRPLFAILLNSLEKAIGGSPNGSGHVKRAKRSSGLCCLKREVLKMGISWRPRDEEWRTKGGDWVGKERQRERERADVSAAIDTIMTQCKCTYVSAFPCLCERATASRALSRSHSLFAVCFSGANFHFPFA